MIRVLLVCLAIAAPAIRQSTTAVPTSVVEELLATDSQFAAESATTTVVPALTAMFADDVVMPIVAPVPGFAQGKAEAAKALGTNPQDVLARLKWAPIRGGISADAQHGFTFGYMTATTADGKTTPLKYVAYWIRQPSGWRVAVYRRVPADRAPSSTARMDPAVPARLVPVTSDPTVIGRHKASLEAAEKAFSDDAQSMGLGPAFAKHGSADAMNVGPRSSPHFIIGALGIAKSVGAGSEGKPSPVSWAADAGSLVASSGDLGITLGYIRQNTSPAEGRPAAVPFFTIWRRAATDQPWRYLAE